MRLDPDEIIRVNRVRIATRLHKLPSEIDAMPASDVDDLLEVWWADEQK